MIVNARALSRLACLLALVGCNQVSSSAAEAGPVASASVSAAACLQLEQGWVRAPLPGRAMTAAYGQLHNRCDRPVPLAHLHSGMAAKVELHRTEIVDGVSRMRAEVQPQVPAGGVLELAPGGLHLMLHGPAAEVVDGGQLTLSLGTTADDVLTVPLPVRRAAGAGQTAAQDHDGQH